MIENEKTYKVAIIGGGISGLAAAYRLLELRKEKQFPIEFTLFESSNRFGGVIRSQRRDGFLLEAGPDSVVTEKPQAINLAKRLGIDSEIIPTNENNRRSFIAQGGKLHPVPEGFHLLAPSMLLPFLKTDIFTLAGKARMGLEMFIPKRKNANGADDESLANFVRRRFGVEALERMAQPMVGGIYTADPEKLSLRATMPRFLDMEQNSGSVIRALVKARGKQQDALDKGTSGARYSLFVSFKDGMQTLVDALIKALPPEALCLNTKVTSLKWQTANGKWLITYEDSRFKIQDSKVEETKSIEFQDSSIQNPKSKIQNQEFDAVCLAMPTYASASLIRPFDSELGDELDSIPYASSATMNLAYRLEDIPHKLDGFGFVVPFIEKRTLMACTFCHVKYTGRAPKGFALLRAFIGGDMQPEMFALDEREMLEGVRRDLKELLGITAAPVFVETAKWARSMAQYHLGHLEKIARINERLKMFPSLKLLGNGYSGAGVPDCVRIGETAAEEISSLINKH